MNFNILNFKPDFVLTEWNSHLPLLYSALELTRIGNVYEFGMGDNSTPFLHDYCLKHNRNLLSFDDKLEWINKFSVMNSPTHVMRHIKDWNLINYSNAKISVALIDNEPNETRAENIWRISKITQIIIIHDTEDKSERYFLYNRIWHLFKYRKDYEKIRARASAVSNMIDLSQIECIDT